MLAEARRSKLTGRVRIMMHRQGQEQVTMTAAQPVSPVTEGIRSLEVRWIFPGQLETAVAGWFARFPAELETREDTYLLSALARAFGKAPRRRGT